MERLVKGLLFMKKNILFILFLFLGNATSSFAHESYLILSPEKNNIMSQLNLPESAKKEFAETRKQIKTKGYFSTYSENASLLQAYRNKKAITTLNKESDPYYKNPRKSPSEFPLSFPFYGVSSVDGEHLLGFVPSGSFEDSRWTGVTGYFNNDDFGTCRIIVFDMPSVNGTSVYDVRYTTHDINDKPTTTHVEGNQDSGFIYQVSWTGKRYEKMLECANKKAFDSQTLKNLVAYAKIIDLDLPDEP